jgi:hypothetical protein
MLRTLQTASYLQIPITNSKDTTLFVNTYLTVKNKAGLLKDPLTKGALAKISKPIIIQHHLDSLVKDLKLD